MTIIVWSTSGVSLHEKKEDAFGNRYYLENESDWPCYDSWESPDEDMAALEEEYAAYAAYAAAWCDRMQQNDQAKLIGRILVSDGGEWWTTAESVYDETEKQPLLDKWIQALGAQRVRWREK